MALAPETPRSHNKIISVPDAAILPQTNVASATGKHDQYRPWSCRGTKKNSDRTAFTEGDVNNPFIHAGICRANGSFLFWMALGMGCYG